MDWMKIIDLIMAVGCVAAFIAITYVKVRGDLSETITYLIAEAEKMDLAGSAKMDQVVSQLYDMVPATLKPFLSEETLRIMAQRLFDYMRQYALNYVEAKKEPDGVAEMQALFASNAETTANLVTELMGLTEAALIRKAMDSGAEIEPEMTKEQIIQAIIIHLLKKA